MWESNFKNSGKAKISLRKRHLSGDLNDEMTDAWTEEQPVQNSYAGSKPDVLEGEKGQCGLRKAK